MLTSLRRSLTASAPLRRAMCTAAVPGESGTVAVNGVNIFYRKNGSAGLPILCMPGAMGACAFFTHVLKTLSASTAKRARALHVAAAYEWAPLAFGLVCV